MSRLLHSGSTEILWHLFFAIAYSAAGKKKTEFEAYILFNFRTIQRCVLNRHNVTLCTLV